MDGKNIAIALGIGLVAGWLASFVVGGGGAVQYLVSGVLGNAILGIVGVAMTGILGQLIVAIVGACIVIYAYRAIKGRTAA